MIDTKELTAGVKAKVLDLIGDLNMAYQNGVKIEMAFGINPTSGKTELQKFEAWARLPGDGDTQQ